MKYLSTNIIIFILLLTSCKKSIHNSHLYDFENYETIEETYVIGDSSVFMGNPFDIKIVHGWIVLYDPYDGYLTTWISPSYESFRCIKKGLGPEELLSPISVFQQGDSVKIFERSTGRFHSFPWENVLNNELKQKITKDIAAAGCFAAPCGDNYVFNRMEEDWNLFSLVSSQGELLCRFGKYPGENDKNYEDVHSADFATQSLVITNEIGNVVVGAGRYSDMLSFYKVENNKPFLIKEYFTQEAELDVLKDKNGWHSKPNVNTMKTYISLTSTQSYIYALYWGTKWSEREAISYIQIFDWNGEFIKGYRCNERLSSIAVSNDDSLLYGISKMETPEINVYGLNHKCN